MDQRTLFAALLLLGLAGPATAQNNPSSQPLPTASAPAVIAVARPEPPVLQPEVLVPAREVPPVQPASSYGLQPVSGNVEVPPQPPAPPGSVLSVEVTGPASAAPGQPVPCVITVRNQGSASLAGVRIDLPLPAGVSLLAALLEPERIEGGLRWTLGALEAAAERRLEVELQSANLGELCLVSAATFSPAGLRTSIVRPPLSLTVHGGQSASPGDKVHLQVQLRNNSEKVMRQIRLRCELPGELLHPEGREMEAVLDGDLMPGQTRTDRLEVQAVTAGRHRVFFRATAEGWPPGEAVTTVAVNEKILSMAVKGPRQGAAGQELSFQIELTNTGRNTSGAARLTEALPAGLEFTSASTGGVYDLATHSVSWPVLLLQAEQRQTVTFQARAKQSGDWALGALVQGEGMAELRTTHSIQIEASPAALTVDAVSLDDPIEAGKETVYEIRVYNPGPAPARAVRLVLQVPDVLQPATADGPSECRVQGQQVFFAPMPELRGRTDAVYRVRVRGVRGGEGRFRIDVHATGMAQPLSRELVTHVRPEK